MNDVLAAVKDIKLPDLSDVLKALVNKDIDIDERWEAYTTLVNNKVLNDVEPYGHGHTELFSKDRHTIVSEFYMERYETMLYPDMYEAILDIAEDNDWEGSRIQEWREFILANGKSGFKFDW